MMTWLEQVRKAVSSIEANGSKSNINSMNEILQELVELDREEETLLYLDFEERVDTENQIEKSRWKLLEQLEKIIEN